MPDVPTLPDEIAAAMQEVPYSVIRLRYDTYTVLDHEGVTFETLGEAQAECNRLNQIHREQRVAALIAEREKAAASDKMFKQMLVDYQRSIDRTRAALEKAGVR